MRITFKYLLSGSFLKFLFGNLEILIWKFGKSPYLYKNEHMLALLVILLIKQIFVNVNVCTKHFSLHLLEGEGEKIYTKRNVAIFIIPPIVLAPIITIPTTKHCCQPFKKHVCLSLFLPPPCLFSL